VAPAVVLSLLTITVTFFPIFALTGQEGALFRPLAAAKTIVMATAALMTLTLAPALRVLISRKEVLYGMVQPKSRVGMLVNYERVVRLVVRHPKMTIAVAAGIVLATVPIYFRLGREFMPPLNEETILYMPTTLPGISAAEVLRVLQTQDAALVRFPEVARVYGKAGRAQTATDPAPLSMIETTIVLKPRAQWRERPRWYSRFSPEWLKSIVLRKLADDRIPYDDLIREMNVAVALPGIVNSWTMPIRGRTEMLNTGARTPVALKVLGPDLKTTDQLAQKAAGALSHMRGTRSVFAERPGEGYFVDVELNRDRLANYGLQVGDVQEVIAGAIGGAEVAEIFEDRARYPVSVRYPKEFRDTPENIGRITVPSEGGERIPLEDLATVRQIRGPEMIRTENGMLASYVFVDTESDDIGTYVQTAQREVERSVSLPAGCAIEWSGEYANMLRAKRRLQIVVPVTLLMLVLLLYGNTKSWIKTGIIVLAVPFSMVGAVWLQYLLNYNVSIATWVGMIGLVGLDAETGVFMLLFLDLAYEQARQRGLLNEEAGLIEAVVDGAAKRVRPKLMTVAAAFMGLMPSMLAIGTGADMAKRIVAPMVGGLGTSFVLELVVYPAAYFLWKGRRIAE
jgi:Cu(I)/Ag(I) efflux system membrane protein CusA/SilA